MNTRSERGREARFRVYDEIRARNRDKRPAEVEADVAEAVAAVRKERETDEKEPPV